MMSSTLRVAPHKRGHFSTIQSAINSARPGSTISIEPGQYFEQIRIDRPVNLVARAKGVSVDTRQGNALFVATDEASITGLDFRSWDPQYPTVWCGGGTLSISNGSVWAASGSALEANGVDLSIDSVSFASDRGLGVVIDGVVLTMTNSVIYRCGQSGMKAANSTIRLETMRVLDCTGNGLFLSQSVAGSITNCDFSECGGPMVYAGSGASVEMVNCNFHDSSSLGTSGENKGVLTITGCEFRDLRGQSAAIFADEGNTTRVQKSSVINCFFGIGSKNARIEANETRVDNCRIGVSMTDGGFVSLQTCAVRQPEIAAIKCIGGICHADEVTIEAGECSEAAVSVFPGSEFRGRKVSIDSGLDAGVLVRGTAVLDDCRVSRSTKAGIAVEEPGALTAANLVVDSPEVGILISGRSIARLTRAQITGTGMDGIGTSGHGAKVVARQVTVTDAGGCGFGFAEGAGGELSDVVVNGCGRDGVFVDDGCSPKLVDIDVEGQGGVAVRVPEHLVARASVHSAKRDEQCSDGMKEPRSSRGVSDPGAQLEELVGLGAVKRDVADVINFIDLERRQKEAGLVAEPNSAPSCLRRSAGHGQDDRSAPVRGTTGFPRRTRERAVDRGESNRSRLGTHWRDSSTHDTKIHGSQRWGAVHRRGVLPRPAVRRQCRLRGRSD